MRLPLVAACALAATASGCTALHSAHRVPARSSCSVAVPRELHKVSLPPYVLEPPDILLIDVLRTVPRGPYRIQSLDVVHIDAQGVLPQRPVSDNYVVEPGGSVNLGSPYGYVRLGGMTLPEATEALAEHLRRYVRDPAVWITLAETSARQQIAGEHLVGPDGTVQLGSYGAVYVAGMTKEEARAAIEAHLARWLEDPEVSLDVLAYNSKVYYVIVQGAGYGDGITRLPVTGNETVLDAVSHIQGLQPFSSKRIWIARPAPSGNPCAQILPVDWVAITQRGDTTTNHQVLPGDRVFVAEDKWVAANTFLDKIVSPIERICGFSLLALGTAQQSIYFKSNAQRGRGLY